jgi:hypothetical protein
MYDFDLIPESAYHEAVYAAFGDCRLERNSGQYNFRCPICGGSKSDLRSRNTHVYFGGGKFTYHCFQGTCVKGTPLLSVLRKHFPSIYQNTIVYGLIKRKGQKEANRSEEIKKFFFSGMSYFDAKELIPITSGHPLAISAVEEVTRRKIPAKYWREWYVAIEGKEFTEELGGKGNKFRNRIIIPFYKRGGGWAYFQGRDLTGKHPAKYLNPSKEREIYRIDFLNWNRKFYVTEGPIDSCFIDNAIATGGSAGLKLLRTIPKFVANRRNAIFITDNFIVDQTGMDDYNNLINSGFSVFDWNKVDDSSKYKDINDLVMSGTVPLNDDGTIVTEYIDARVIHPTLMTKNENAIRALKIDFGL